MGEISGYLRKITVDWNDELLPDAAEPRVSISCGSIREAAARIEALEEALRDLLAESEEFARVIPPYQNSELLRRARAVLEDKS